MILEYNGYEIRQREFSLDDDILDPFAGYVNANEMIAAANHPKIKRIKDWIEDENHRYIKQYQAAGWISFEGDSIPNLDNPDEVILVMTDVCWVNPFVARFLAYQLGDKFFAWFTGEITRLADAGDVRWSWIYDERKLGWGLDLPAGKRTSNK